MATQPIMTKTITIMGAVLGALLMSSRFIDGIHTFLGASPVISIIELYLILLSLGVLFYQHLKLNLMETKFKKEMDEMHTVITDEYTQFVNQKLERLEIMISQSNEDIKEIKEDLKIISKNILDLATH